MRGLGVSCLFCCGVGFNASWNFTSSCSGFEVCRDFVNREGDVVGAKNEAVVQNFLDDKEVAFWCNGVCKGILNINGIGEYVKMSVRKLLFVTIR